MSILKQKSIVNIVAAESLLKENLYAPSVHCSYYSCFQLLKYTIKEFFGIDYKAQAEIISQSRQKSHQYVVNYITSELVELDSAIGSRRLRRAIKDLKHFRVESDYQNIEVTMNKSREALTKEKEIRSYLTTNFHI